MRLHHAALALGLAAACTSAPPRATPDASPERATAVPAEPSPAAPAATIAPAADDEVFTETVITTGADGTTRVETHPITAAAERAQNAARARARAGEPTPLVDQDLDCQITSAFLYDRPDFTGNRICFSGEGELSLSSYFRTVRIGTFRGRPYYALIPWAVADGSAFAGADLLEISTSPNLSPVDGGVDLSWDLEAWNAGAFHSGGAAYGYLGRF